MAVVDMAAVDAIGENHSRSCYNCRLHDSFINTIVGSLKITVIFSFFLIVKNECPLKE